MLKSKIIPKLASDLLEEASNYQNQHGKLSDEILTQLHSIFGNTLIAASELLENCKITQYQTSDQIRSVYKVGINLERYTIYEDINYCQCSSFKSEVLEDQTSITCKHVLALILNQLTNSVQIRNEIVTDSQFVKFLNEQLNYFNN